MANEVKFYAISIAGQIAGIIEAGISANRRASLHKMLIRSGQNTENICYFHNPLGKVLGDDAPICPDEILFEGKLWDAVRTGYYEKKLRTGVVVRRELLSLGSTVPGRNKPLKLHHNQWLFFYFVHCCNRPSSRIKDFLEVAQVGRGIPTRIWEGYLETLELLKDRLIKRRDEECEQITLPDSGKFGDQPAWVDIFLRLGGRKDSLRTLRDMIVCTDDASIKPELFFGNLSEQLLDRMQWTWGADPHPRPHKFQLTPNRGGRTPVMKLCKALTIDRCIANYHRIDLSNELSQTSAPTSSETTPSTADKSSSSGEEFPASLVYPMNDHPNELERRDIAFGCQTEIYDAQEASSTDPKDGLRDSSRFLETAVFQTDYSVSVNALDELPDWFELISGRELYLEIEETQKEEPGILVISGREEDFRALFPEPDYSWVAAVEFMLDGRKHETYAMNLEFKVISEPLTSENARAYLEIQQWQGIPGLDPAIAINRKLRIRKLGGARISLARIWNDAENSETSVLIRVYLEDDQPER